MLARNSRPVLHALRLAARIAVCATALVLASAAVAKDDPWIRVSTPEFTLVTSLTEREAVAWAGEFSQFIAELRGLFRVQRPLPPLTIVIFTNERAFEDYRPLNAEGKPEKVAGFFQRHPSWAVAGLSGRNATAEVRHTIFHEGVHWFLSALDRENPVWVEEGLAEVFSTFAMTKKDAEWGRPIPEHVYFLREEKMLPIERLLYVGHGELFRDDSIRTGIVYAQSWMTVHFLVHGESKEIPRSALFDYINLTHGGMPMEPAFQKAVGSDFATFDRRLKAYLQSGRYFLHTKPLVPLPPLHAEPAPPFEVAQALGRLSLAARRWDKATAFAQNSISLAPEDPRGFELLGLARNEGGDPDGGRKAFTTAVEKGSKDFQPYFELAAAAQNAALEGKPAAELPRGEARRIADNYEKAIQLSPRFLPSYQNLAALLNAVDTLPGDRDVLELGHKIFPDDGWIRLGLAVLTDRGGDQVGARKTADEVEADANQPARVRAYARQLADTWVRQDVVARLEALIKERKLPDALAYVQEQLTQPMPSSLRNHLTTTRTYLRGELRSEEIGAAYQEKRWDEARRLLTDTLESPEMPLALKQKSKRALEDLNRRPGPGTRPATSRPSL